MNKPLRVGIVAGEASGDILGVGLMKAIKEKYPLCIFEGIGGPRMIAEGFVSLAPMERLSVMGFVEILGNLPELLRIKKKVVSHFLATPPDVFVGIDSPGFNIPVETSLHKSGVKTIQYVGPSVWAYRENRIKKIALAVDMVLTLLPFESEIYRRNNISARYVGHTLADQISLESDAEADKSQARTDLAIDVGKTTIVLLPGSRKGEVSRMAGIFIEAAKKCLRDQPNTQFLIPSVNEERKQQLSSILADHKCGKEFVLLDGQSHLAIKAADFALMASGTVTLEALLHRRPMVVCYKVNPVTYFFISRMLKVPYISLPNLLAGKKIVPEYLQGAVTVDNLSRELNEFMTVDERANDQLKEFSLIHKEIRCDADRRAASSILEIAVNV